MSRPKKLVVVGQGYVGLPLAMRAVDVGYSVVGLDLDSSRVGHLRNGVSYVEDISSARLTAALATSRYLPSSTYQDATEFDVAVITVPTPLSEGMPDLRFIKSSGKLLADHIRRGCTVVLESTTYPGTTDELLSPILEGVSGLRAGSDFHLGYSPERVDPGNDTFGLVNTPKIVSGVNDASLISVRAFYDTLVDRTVAVTSCRVAELAKLLENTFRHVNIALVNELAMFAHDLNIDIWEAIDASSTKPFGYLRFTPGPGVGGHCLPIDPSYLSWDVKRRLGMPFRFVELANDVNDHMPDYVVRRIIALLNAEFKSVNASQILLLGLAYKKNTGDTRQSPAVKVAELLLLLGADVRAADPHVLDIHGDLQIPRVTLTAAEVDAADLVVVLTDHDSFDYGLLKNARLVFDTRRVVSDPDHLL